MPSEHDTFDAGPLTTRSLGYGNGVGRCLA